MTAPRSGSDTEAIKRRSGEDSDPTATRSSAPEPAQTERIGRHGRPAADSPASGSGAVDPAFDSPARVTEPGTVPVSRSSGAASPTTAAAGSGNGAAPGPVGSSEPTGSRSGTGSGKPASPTQGTASGRTSPIGPTGPPETAGQRPSTNRPSGQGSRTPIAAAGTGPTLNGTPAARLSDPSTARWSASPAAQGSSGAGFAPPTGHNRAAPAPNRAQAPPRPAGPPPVTVGAEPVSRVAASPGAPIPTRPPNQQRARRAPVRGPRRARLQLRHIDPWSALKFSLVLSIALFFVWMVAIGVLYGVLNGLDVFSQINSLWRDLQGTQGQPIVTPSLVFGGAAVIGAVNILLFTALATIGAFIYNLCADLVGGLEITLGERD